MAAGKRKSRADELEEALFAALDTPVPPRDVVSDPGAILGDAAGKEACEGEAGGRAAQDERQLEAEMREAAERIEIGLSPAGQKRLDDVASMASGILGREVSRSEALKIMLEVCYLDQEFVKRACREMSKAKTADKGDD